MLLSIVRLGDRGTLWLLWLSGRVLSIDLAAAITGKGHVQRLVTPLTGLAEVNHAARGGRRRGSELQKILGSLTGFQRDIHLVIL